MIFIAPWRSRSNGGGLRAPVQEALNGAKNTRNPDLGPISILGFYFIFIKIGLMGWIRIDFALLNTFANCDFYRFFEILTFSAKTCVEQGVNKA